MLNPNGELRHFKTRMFAAVFFSIIILVLVSPAHSLKAPHSAVNDNITQCSQCHSRTGAGFATITSQNVLCINGLGCHRADNRADKKRFTTLDASNRFGNLPAQTTGSKPTSHGWKIPNLNPDAGVTQTNKWGELATGVGKGLNDKITCTRCHRAHGEKTGYVIHEKFLRQTPKGDYICLQCHAARQIDNVRDPLPTGKHYSHPVEVNYSTIQASRPDFFEKTPVNPYPSNPSAALPLFTTVNVDGFGRVTGAKGTGQVVCSTCHGPLHSSDSNPYTFDNISIYSRHGTYSSSDGDLLRRYPMKKSNDLCSSCHKVQTHKEFICGRCHTPHKKAGEQNRYLIHENISTPNSGKKAVQFVSTSNMAQRYGESNKICQVCHTKTGYHRNYSSTGVKRDHKYKAATNNYIYCPDCHKHIEGFPKLESPGGKPCYNCHADFFNPMNTNNGRYHHYLNNAETEKLTAVTPFGNLSSKYPVINPPAPLQGQDDGRRRCLMCHVDHDIFRPTDYAGTYDGTRNPYSPGRAYNLRPDISVLPNRTTHGMNTEFISRYGQYSGFLKPQNGRPALAPNGGICMSCHQNSQYKSYQQPDGTSRTPVINKELFDDSPHQYEAESQFINGAGIFLGNCSKCHTDTMNKGKQVVGGNQFGSHFSNIRRINAAMINENNTGTATSGTTNSTIEDTTKSWTAGIWASMRVTILDGTGKDQTRKIRSNATTTFTVATSFSSALGTDSVYLIGDSRGNDSGTPTSATSTTVTDTTKTWITNYWTNRSVTIVSGPGYGQSRKITSNTPTQFTVDAAWDTTLGIPDTTSIYSIGDPAEEEVCYRCHSNRTNPNAGETPPKDYYGVRSIWNEKVLKMEEIFNDATKPFKHRIEAYFGRHRGDESVNAPEGATATGWFNEDANGLHVGCADCHNPHGNRRPGEDNGQVTFGTFSTLTQTGKAWEQDKWRGYTLRLMDGPGRGQDRMIVKNTADTITVGAYFDTNKQPPSGKIGASQATYYIITPIGLPDKGNNLWNPNSGTWGVLTDYTADSAKPAIGSLASPVFTKKQALVGGQDKIYNLCFKCHSEYGWGTSGTPFDIPDAIQ